MTVFGIYCSWCRKLSSSGDQSDGGSHGCPGNTMASSQRRRRGRRGSATLEIRGVSRGPSRDTWEHDVSDWMDG